MGSCPNYGSFLGVHTKGDIDIDVDIDTVRYRFIMLVVVKIMVAFWVL